MISLGRKAQIVPCFGSVEYITCLWIACAVLTLVASEEYPFPRYGKRGDPREASFFISGSRYGRSDVSQKSGQSVPKLVEVVPRMERFYLGSRYGKRSPKDYRSVSSLNRFNAVLDYMDHVDRIDVDPVDDVRTDDDDLEVLS